jgi:hypothetical protein
LFSTRVLWSRYNWLRIRIRHSRSFRIVIRLAIKFQILTNSQNCLIFSRCCGSGFFGSSAFLTPWSGNRDVKIPDKILDPQHCKMLIAVAFYTVLLLF